MKQERGAVLAVSLMILLIITILGVSTIQVTHMQEKMSGHYQDKLLSFTAAETALRAGENWLMSIETLPPISSTCSTHPCVQELDGTIDLTTQSDSWWTANSAAYGADLADVSSQPRYRVELIRFIPDSPKIGTSSMKSNGVYFYQITSRAKGASNTSLTMLQSTISRRY